jgi:hypothetical protein
MIPEGSNTGSGYPFGTFFFFFSASNIAYASATN